MTKESTARSSAVRDAIAGTAPKGVDVSKQPVTQEELAALGDVLLWRVLIEPYIPTYQGVLARAQSTEEAEATLAKVGRILAIGCFCFKSKTTAGLDLSEATPRLQVGDYVLFEMYAGQEVTLRSGKKVRLLTETELLLRVKDPEIVRAYL